MTREREPSALAASAELGMAEFQAIAAIMQREARIHLAESKRTLVHSRLSRRLREHGLPSFRDYVALVDRDEQERATMVTALTTNHTHFFREEHHFEHLRRVAMPRLKARAAAGEPVRIWSAGSSSGEEVYSIAMTLAGEDKAGAAWLRQGNVRLLATDISPPMVAAVNEGVYADATVQPIPAACRKSWLQKHERGHVVDEELRGLVTARVLNLFGPWPMRHRYDVIFCRNVMIYFDEAAKAELEARFVEMLPPGGYLYIGHSERLIGPAAAKMRSEGQTIYARADGEGGR